MPFYCYALYKPRKNEPKASVTQPTPIFHTVHLNNPSTPVFAPHEPTRNQRIKNGQNMTTIGVKKETPTSDLSSGFPIIDTTSIARIPSPNLQTFQSPTQIRIGDITIKKDPSLFEQTKIPQNTNTPFANSSTERLPPCLMLDTIPSPSRKRKWSKPRSINGCFICRLRHLKCDESKPSCNRCRKIKIQCDYAEDFKNGKPGYLDNDFLKNLKLVEIKDYTSKM